MILEVNDLALPPRLQPTSFVFDKGEILHVLGANGSGKSTLLSLVSGLLRGQGQVSINQKPLKQCSVEALSRYRSYLSQRQSISFQFAVYQYLIWSLPCGCRPESKLVMQAIKQICDQLNLTDKLNRPVTQLSGGEWQRVRLAGVCLQVLPSLNPDACLLILDEPATGLDPAQEAVMYQLIRWIARQGIAVIMSNHDLTRTLNEADQVLLLKKGQALCFGKPDFVMTPVHLKNAYGMNFLVGSLQHQKVILPQDPTLES